MLAVLCAYILELAPDSSRFKAGLTFDAFAGQPPHLISWELHIDVSGSATYQTKGKIPRRLVSDAYQQLIAGDVHRRADNQPRRLITR